MTFFSAVVRPGFERPLAALKSAPREALLDTLVPPSQMRMLRVAIAALEDEGFVELRHRGSREYVVRLRTFPGWVTGRAGHFGVFDMPRSWRIDADELARFAFPQHVRAFDVLHVSQRRRGRRRTPAVYVKHLPPAGAEDVNDLLVALLRRDGTLAAKFAAALDPKTFDSARARIHGEALYFRARYFGIARILAMRPPRKRRKIRRDARRRADFADDAEDA